MSTWIERVAGHAVHAALSDLEAAIEAAQAKAEEVDGASDGLIRLKHVAQYIVRRLEAVDHHLTSVATLDSVAGQVKQARDQVNQFAGSGNAGHLDSANGVVDKLLPTLATLVVPSSVLDVEALHVVVEEFSRFAQDRTQGLTEKVRQGAQAVDSLDKAVIEIRERVDREKQRIDTAVSQHQQQFSEAQESRQQSFANAEKQRSTEAKGLLTSIDAEASTRQAAQEDAFEQLLAASKESQQAAREEAEEAAKLLLSNISAKRDEAKKIVGIIAGTGMAGGYQRDADTQEKSFKAWSMATVAGFVGLIAFAVWLFIATTAETEFTWSATTSRLVAIAAFGLFSVYAGRMAMKHRESERQHRHKQLALESVNAFLEDLDPEVQKEVKTLMAKEFFTQSHTNLRTDEDVVPTTVDGLLKLVAKAFDIVARR